jgi:hypothetical protein
MLVESASGEERKSNELCYITVRQNTTGKANINPANIKLICVATDTDRYYPVSLLNYKDTEMLNERVLLQISGGDFDF